MTADQIIVLKNVICMAILLGMVVLLVNGVNNLIRYFRTRERARLVTGLLCTPIVPGLMLCALIVYVLPYAFIMYAPPPSHNVP